MVAGPYSAYRAHLEAEQAVARQDERSAEQALRREQRQRVQAETVLARRARYARTDYENKRKPKVVMNQRRTEAQVSAGKLRAGLDEDVDQARAVLQQARARVREDTSIHLELPDPQVPAGRRIAELRGRGCIYIIQGPERVALSGPNGVGKRPLCWKSWSIPAPRPGLGPAALAPRRTLCAWATSPSAATTWTIASACSTTSAPPRPSQQLRHALARFRLRAGAIHRPVASLSGGERFRVVWPACCWPTPRTSFWSWTSPPTTWTPRPSTSSWARWPPTAVPCSWSATTTPSWSASS